MLQFITSQSSEYTILQQVKGALDGGCMWIQLRMKENSDDDVRKTIEQIKPLCEEYGAFLILNDRVELAKELGVSGVHVGQEDMSPIEARNILGAEPVIGVTCNTFEQIKAVSELDIDYIGVGPFKYTKTKKNLKPTIGFEGYKNIVAQMKASEIKIPIVAVGGITLSDVKELKEIGINGIAVSSSIACAEDPTLATREYIKILQNN